MKDEENTEDQAGGASGVVPFQLFAEISDGKNRKYGKGDHFLNGLELRGIEFVGANAIRGYLKALFEKGDAPTGENHFPQAFVAVF